MPRSIPVYDGDMFGREAILNARAVDDLIRETAPVVWLARENIAIIGRYSRVVAGLTDWQSFSSRSRPWTTRIRHGEAFSLPTIHHVTPNCAK